MPNLPPVTFAENRLPAVEEVTNYLRDAISYGDLAAGTPLRQEEIAALFEVSHIPVREAFKVLIGEGLVAQQRNRAVLVAPMSLAYALELTEYRALLEERLMLWAVPNLEARDIADARSCLEELTRVTDAKTRLRLAAEFHTLIYRKANRPFFLSAVRGARNNLNRYWRLVWEQEKSTQASQHEHHAILQACQAGNSQEAARQVAEHVRSFGERVIQVLADRGSLP